MVRRGDHYGVDVLAVKELPEIMERLGLMILLLLDQCNRPVQMGLI